MTGTRAPADPYTTRFETTVEHRDGRDVVLAETYFYAESGGQPADRGTLGDHQVVDVQHSDDGVVHTLTEEPALGVGETVVGQVDEQFRTYCVRAHTASHVLYGAGRRLLEDLGYGGFNISPEKVRVDFRTSTEIDDDVLLALERLTNRAVWESRPVSWETHPQSEALTMDQIAFNTKTEEGLAGESVRVVTVGGDDDAWDVAACGGTHVQNTREIGPVTVLERSNPGEGLTRVEFTVGPQAIDRRVTEKEAVYEASQVLGTSVEDVPDAVERLQNDRREIERERTALQEQLVTAQLTDLRDETFERDDGTWLAGAVDGMGPNELSEKAAEFVDDETDVVVLCGRDGRTFVVVSAGEGFDAAGIVDTVTAEFGGGGGGSGETAQGGGIEAPPDEIVAYLRE
jgi:alanyl-tRNA synthetase